eukprot:TRINITY_DN55221_c0_g1_i1.p1 TRINITY_DN55221_c0_g1~~TRINITY_DN55221_c0_g1_i1.p1  ORF type:complete len:760 (-),score=111.48 TRINITY_DN55221_c0_g1_i1:34-2313(-)
MTGLQRPISSASQNPISSAFVAAATGTITSRGGSFCSVCHLWLRGRDEQVKARCGLRAVSAMSVRRAFSSTAILSASLADNHALELAPWSAPIVGVSGTATSACDSLASLLSTHGGDVGVAALATTARVAKANGVRDPFLWRALRLRAIMLGASLSVADIASMLGGCSVVGLVDIAFLEEMCSRLDILLHFGSGPSLSPGALVTSCNALLRLGLATDAPLFDKLLRGIAPRASKLSACHAALLTTCLARLRRPDSFLLGVACERVLRVHNGGDICDIISLKQLSMLLASLAHLRDELGGAYPEALGACVADRLIGIVGGDVKDMPCGGEDAKRMQRRSLLAVLASESANLEKLGSAKASSLTSGVVHQLSQLKRVAARPAELHRVAKACSHWRWLGKGGEIDIAKTLALRALEELAAWAKGRRPTWPHLSAARLLRLLEGLVPFAVAQSQNTDMSISPHSGIALEELLDHIGSVAPQFALQELITAVDLCGIAVTTTHSPETAYVKTAQALRGEVFRRVHEFPLQDLTRVLGSLLQLQYGGEIVPVVRRCVGRVALELQDALKDAPGGNVGEYLSGILSVDSLGEILYACASCNYTDADFLEICAAWLLAFEGVLLFETTVVRDVSFVHVVHSLAVLGTSACREEVLDVVAAAMEPRIQGFGPFEILGLLDAVVLLQERAASQQQDPAEAASRRDVVPPLGLGQRALRAAVDRLDSMKMELNTEERRLAFQLLEKLELPDGTRNPLKCDWKQEDPSTRE